MPRARRRYSAPWRAATRVRAPLLLTLAAPIGIIKIAYRVAIAHGARRGPCSNHRSPAIGLMQTNFAGRCLAYALGGALLVSIAPRAAEAQSGKWVGTVSQMSIGGAADLAIESRNDKQSRARITLRNSRSNIPLAWDIVEGSCRDEGKPVAAAAAFTRIQTQMDGGGTVTSNIPKLESGKRYYVRVFDPQNTSRTDASALGCANLSEQP
jgi:hypothetical protein